MDAVRNLIYTKLSIIPKEFIPLITWGLVFAALLFVIIFFAICVAYINMRPTVVSKRTSQPDNHKISKDKEIVVRYEELPLIPGRVGEFLASVGLINVGPITKIFLKVLEVFRHSTHDLRWRYKFPCFMLLGAPKSGKTTLANSLGFDLLGSSDVSSMWKIFKRGALFEFPAESPENISKLWDFIADLFVFIRPRRPLDGIIITISAEELMSDSTNVVKIAHETFDRVFKFQKDINFRLPIYIIVTKSDLIRGFGDFAHLLNAELKQQIFGWSSPYTLSTAFSESWISEIFKTLDAGINKAILSFAARKSPSQHLSEAIAFQYHFNAIKDSIFQYLQTMFKTHSPEDGLIFRGIYFVGEQKHIENPSQDILEPSVLSPKCLSDIHLGFDMGYDHSLYFVQDLFSEKIFREGNVAHPLHADPVDMRREEFKKQTIVIGCTSVIVLGWLWGNYNIKHEINQYHKSIYDVLVSMRKISNIEQNIDDIGDKHQIDRYTEELIKNIPPVKWNSFFSIFVPQSWFSDLRARIQETINLTFDSVVARAVYIDLNLNTNKVLETSRHNAQNRPPKIDLFNITSFASFRQLKEFAIQIERMKQLGEKYNNMRNYENGREVVELMKQIFGTHINMDDVLKNHVPNKQIAMPEFEIDIFQDKADQTLTTIFKAILQDILDETIIKLLTNVVGDINAMITASQNPFNTYTANNLAKLYNKCTLISDLVKNKNFAWIKKEHFIPCAEYATIMGSLRKSGVVSHECITELLSQAEGEFTRFKIELRGVKSVLTNELVSEKMTISDEFMAFQKELKALLEKEFICAVGTDKLVTHIPSDKMLFLDPKILANISTLIDKYSEFFTELPPEFRAQYYEIYKRVAAKCFYPVVQSMIGKSEVMYDKPIGGSQQLLEDAQKKQSENVRKIAVVVPKIIKIFDEMQTWYNFQDCGFTSMIINHYMESLNSIDAIFSAEKLYSYHNAIFDGWDGDSAPKFMDMRDPNTLRQYLARQFEHVKFLAKDLAEPLIDVLGNSIVYTKLRDKTLVDKWKAIIASVDDYDKKTPGNSIAALEDFLSNKLAGISINNFDTEGDIKSISETGGDYFMQARSSVAKTLLSRADEVKYNKAARSYMQIQQFFNQYLSNQFPFGKSDKDVSVRDIENFVNVYDKNAPGVLEILEKHKDAKSINNDAIIFMQTLQKTVSFLRAWVTHAKGTDINTASVLFNIQQRVQGQTEAYTSGVVERTVSINNTVVANSENGAFFNNDKVSVAFKWVDSGEQKPNPQAASGELQVSGVHATFAFGGKWAMFRMIENHKTNKDLDNPDGVLVKFDIPIIDSSQGNKVFQSSMIMKVTPMQKIDDKVTPMEWPIFPAIAPDLHAAHTRSQL